MLRKLGGMYDLKDNHNRAPLDENGMIIYDGRVPSDVDLFADDVQIAFSTLLPLLGLGIKLGLLAYSLYAYFTREEPASTGPLDETIEAFGLSFNNTINPSTNLSIIYGEHKFAPHVFYQKLSNLGNNNRMDIGLGIGEGPIDSISELKVNELDFTDLQGTNSFTLHDGSVIEIDQIFDKIALSQDLNTNITEEGQVIISAPGAVSNVIELEIGMVWDQGLFSAGSRGQAETHTSFSVDYKLSADAIWTTAIDRTKIIENHRGPFRRTFTIVRNLTPGSYDIRVRNHDIASGTDIRDMTVDFVNYYIREDFTPPPDFAHIGMSLEATSAIQGRMPKITVLVKGRKVRVYSDLTTFSTEWSDNPVWCLMDLLTNTRYGLGYLVGHDDLDIQSFIDMATLADGTDMNGARKGRLDLVINRSKPALDWIETILLSFRGILQTVGGAFSLTIERDEASVQTFTSAKIKKGSLTYQYADPADSVDINQVTGSYLNREKDFIRDQFKLPGSGTIAPANIVERDFDLLGLTRPADVEARLRVIFNGMNTNIRAAQWESDISTLQAQVGDVVTIDHPLPGWTGASVKKFRILQIEETEDQSRRIKGIEHNASVFDAEATIATPPIETQLWNPLSTASPIQDLTLEPLFISEKDGTVRTDLGIYWTVTSGAVNFFKIEQYDVFVATSSGTILPSGTAFNPADENSLFFVQPDSTLASGTLFSPFEFIGSTRPPITKFIVKNARSTDFYNVAVVAVTNNLITQDLANAVTKTAFVTTFSGQPNNVAAFTSAFSSDDVLFTWTPVPRSAVTNLAGYEIRDENANFGVEDSSLIFRGVGSNFLHKDVSFRTDDFFIKTFNTNNIYSSTVKSTTPLNAAPAAITQADPVQIGRSIRINWTSSAESDVTGYTIHIDTSAGFSPSSANLFAELSGRDTAAFIFTESDDSFPTRYVQIGTIDALSISQNDVNFSNEKSFTAVPEPSTVDAATINIINDSDFNGISPGYWNTSGSASLSSSAGHVDSGGTLTQFIPFPDRKLRDTQMRMSLFVDAASTPSDLTMTVTGTGGYSKQLTVTGTDITSTSSRFSQVFSVDSIPDSVGVDITTAGGTQINVDKAMLHAGNQALQWIPHTLEIVEGYTDWVGTTQIIDNAIVTNKIVANAVTGAKIAANTITADLYQELRQTLYFHFDGELDASNPLNVMFHLPSELQAAADIIDVKLSYFRRPFRGTILATTSDSSVVGSTSDVTTAGVHTHNISAVPSIIPFQNTYKADVDGVWYRVSGDGATSTATSSVSENHNHTWIIQNDGDFATVNDAILKKIDGGSTALITCANFEGQGVTENGTDDSGFIHKHILIFPWDGWVGIPTTVTEGRSVGFASSSTTQLSYRGSGPIIHRESAEQPSSHSHDFNLPVHSHAVTFGIFEESNAVTIAVRRSDDGSSFEGGDFTSSSSASRLDVDIDSDNFFDAGAGAGFKALQIRSSGVNDGRTRIDGIILVKLDISA